MSDKSISRRNFLSSMAAVPAATVLVSRANAQDLPQITLDDPAAKALKYVHDVAEVDPATPRFEVGQDCSNCAQIQGDAAAEWRPCAIFPGKTVNNKGWCSVWIQKP